MNITERRSTEDGAARTRLPVTASTAVGVLVAVALLVGLLVDQERRWRAPKRGVRTLFLPDGTPAAAVTSLPGAPGPPYLTAVPQHRCRRSMPARPGRTADGQPRARPTAESQVIKTTTPAPAGT